MSIKQISDRITAEHVMLLALIALSLVFLIEPIVQDYPDDARVFPQMTASVVLVGSLLLFVQNYLPGPVRTFVAESVNITAGGPPEEVEEVEDERLEEQEDAVKSERTLGQEYGYNVNDTVFMVATATLYFILGWAAGFLFVTPLFVVGYTTWFRIRLWVGIGLAALSTAIIYLFIEFLILPLDRGAIFDFSPFLPTMINPTVLISGVI